MAIEIATETTTAYRITAKTEATWQSSRAYPIHVAVIRNVTDDGVRRATEFYGLRSSCDRFDDAFVDGDCEPRPWTHETTSSGISTFLPGRQLVLARAYGADATRFDITLETTNEIDAVATWEGSTTLVALGELEQASDGGEEFNASATVSVTEGRVATFMLVGGSLKPPDFSADDGNDAVSFRYRADGTGSYSNDDGQLVMEPTFPVAAGQWTFKATGGRQEPDDVGIPAIGLVHAPWLVNDDGSLRCYGACLA